ncbi:MAG: thiamine-phosphate pyrophosphorylase [Planctomycetota bacterium]
MLGPPDGQQLRARLADARLLLLFTPELAQDPWAALASALPHVDIVQVRPKPLGDASPDANPAVSEARACCDAARRVLELAADLGDAAPLIMIDDRVDVARVLWPEGLAGVHLGQDDCSVQTAREVLGPDPLVGLSTHDPVQAVTAAEQAVDYLGFGPVYAAPTKGYATGLGPERAWVVADTLDLPVFPIGGIDEQRIAELGRIGRAAVGSAILSAADPAAAAQALRTTLTP